MFYLVKESCPERMKGNLMKIEFNDFFSHTLLGCCESILQYLEEPQGSRCNDLAYQTSKRCCIVAKVMYEKRS